LHPRRILVVEDFEPFRRLICSTLQERVEFQVSEASDGWEAVQNAKDRQPDLILLDIALPGLNGIEVARRVRELANPPKILFISQESSSDVVQEAFRSGAAGYIHKPRVGSKLLLAVETIQLGSRFVSGCDAATTNKHTAFHHEVELYSDDAAFIKNLGRFIHSALAIGTAAIVVATEQHRAALARELASLGCDTRRAHADGQYISLDAKETLSKIVAYQMPDPARFTEVIGDIIDEVDDSTFPGVTIFGEMVALLWADGDQAAAIRLEELWNGLGAERSFSLRCAYPIRGFENSEQSRLITQVCAQHSDVYSH
jgi:DNA-binding response OmpR family regulator